MWDAPTQFASGSGSFYTFLDGSAPTPISNAGLSSGDAPESKNTIAKSKTGGNDDVKARMESMQKQREVEFAGVARK
jgi:hypothetical protein